VRHQRELQLVVFVPVQLQVELPVCVHVPLQYLVHAELVALVGIYKGHLLVDLVDWG
jgi:hypothetical protein